LARIWIIQTPRRYTEMLFVSHSYKYEGGAINFGVISDIFNVYTEYERTSAVAQLVEALCYKPEG
jgi:hypothetical protein